MEKNIVKKRENRLFSVILPMDGRSNCAWYFCHFVPMSTIETEKIKTEKNSKEIIFKDNRMEEKITK